MEKPHVSMTDSELLNASLDITELADQPYLSAERKAEHEKQLGYVVFEMMARSGYLQKPKILEVPNGTNTLPVSK